MYTIVMDDSRAHVRAILETPAEVQDLIDKLVTTKEKLRDRRDAEPPSARTVPAEPVSPGAGAPADSAARDAGTQT